MAVYDFNLLSDADVAKDGEEGENRGERCLSVDDKKGDIVHLKAVGEVSHACAVVICVSDDNDFVATVDELAGELIDVRLDASWLREEVVANHSNVVCAPRHLCGLNERTEVL